MILSYDITSEKQFNVTTKNSNGIATLLSINVMRRFGVCLGV